MQQVQSSWIDKVYSNKRKRIIIIETKGNKYTYGGVSKEDIDQLRWIIKKGFSVGEFINRDIKPYYKVISNELKKIEQQSDKQYDYIGNLVRVNFKTGKII